jgi:hypothetical protein
MLERHPSVNLLANLLKEIETGRLEDAVRTSNLLSPLLRDPSVCTRATLDALERARNLALIERSHLQFRLRSLAASRLYRSQVEGASATWTIDA